MVRPGSTGRLKCAIIGCFPVDPLARRKEIRKNHEIPAIPECTLRNLIKEPHTSTVTSDCCFSHRAGEVHGGFNWIMVLDSHQRQSRKTTVDKL